MGKSDVSFLMVTPAARAEADAPRAASILPVFTSSFRDPVRISAMMRSNPVLP